MGITKSGKQKDSLDRFYTKSEVALQCINFFEFFFKLNKFDLVIEPSAGCGSFSNYIPDCLAYDIFPQNEKIIKKDFLKIDTDIFKGKKILVIGNPPFGQQAKEAFNFIEKSSAFADVIAFILPLSFKKKSYYNKMPEYFHFLAEKVLAENSFLFNGQDYSLPCVFQIWEKCEKKRKPLKIKKTTKYFSFVDKDAADFRIQRVGGNAGRAYLDLDAAISSNYFLKNLSSFSNDEIVDIINNLEYNEINWTCGPKSLSKDDLIRSFEKQMEDE